MSIPKKHSKNSTLNRMNLLSGEFNEKGFPGSRPNSPAKVRYNFEDSDIEQDYIEDIKWIYDVVADKTVFEIAMGNSARLTPIYNEYGIKRLFGIEPYDKWYNQSKEILEIYAEFDWRILCSRYEDYTPRGAYFDVTICNGLAYHLHSPYHLFEYLANLGSEYIIMETTGVPHNDNPDWSGSKTTEGTMERIKGTIQQQKTSFEEYLQGKSTTCSTFEEQNIPGNSSNNNRRSIPWSHAGMNPDIRVLAFWCMGYDLDASHERLGGLEHSKTCTTTYRFKKSEDFTRDPRLLAQQ